MNLSGLNSGCADGASIIIAGAGSGKTRVLTWKIACLIESGVEPSSIMALTFTNKAAKEMKERIASIVGRDRSRRLWMGTFHSIFARILREYADLLGLGSTPTFWASRRRLRYMTQRMRRTQSRCASRNSSSTTRSISPARYSPAYLPQRTIWSRLRPT